jgi:hypothetical protein
MVDDAPCATVLMGAISIGAFPGYTAPPDMIGSEIS